MVEKLLFLRKSAQPDIQTKIEFLTTRVKNPEGDYWKKLRRVLISLDATIHNLKLLINENNLNIFHWWVDAS